MPRKHKYSTLEDANRVARVEQRKYREDLDPTPSECEKRLKKWHKRQHSEDPVYMTDNFKEYRVYQPKGSRFWKIKPYKGGYGHPQTYGQWLTQKQASDHLIEFIKRYNIGGYARYPGCPKPRQINYTELFLKDYSPKLHR